MGDMADGILDGDFDEETGEYIGEGQGFPRSLAREARERGKRKEHHFNQSRFEKLKLTLEENGYKILVVKEIDYAIQLRLSSGGIVNYYLSNKINVQGSPDEKLKTLLNL